MAAKASGQSSSQRCFTTPLRVQPYVLRHPLMRSRASYVGLDGPALEGTPLPRYGTRSEHSAAVVWLCRGSGEGRSRKVEDQTSSPAPYLSQGWSVHTPYRPYLNLLLRICICQQQPTQ